MAATIGKSVEDGHLLQISDAARRSGLYILGGPGTGKTQLLINILLADIEAGHGVFFLDPHGDAIDQVLDRLPASRPRSDIILLNPAHETHTFGINVLRCNPDNITERNDAYTRAYGIFERLWRDQMGPWLQLILSNTIPVFIENQGYTLADIPLFLQDKAFRSHLLKNVRHNKDALSFWTGVFGASRETDQQAKVDAALTRLYILLTKEYVRHVISQSQTTVDFAAAMRDRKVILLDLPAYLPEDDKKFLGTVVISELLHVTRNRQLLPESDRGQFCVFVDEFQNFATSRDFGVLITEGRKFGIATTIAHQERFGQLSEDKKIQGATAVVGNKIIFQATVNDARELAPEFFKEPPFEMRKERELVISQSPVAALLAGHTNPEIRQFVDLYLRRLDEKRADAREDIERLRIIRDSLRDDIATDRLNAQLARSGSREGGGSASLSAAKTGIHLAQTVTAQMLDLFDTASDARLTIREFDKVFTGIMQGTIQPVPGNEVFAEFLVGRVQNVQGLNQYQRDLLILYIRARFGSPSIAREVPFDLAQSYSLFPDTVKGLTCEAQERAKREKEEMLTSAKRHAEKMVEESKAQKQQIKNEYIREALETKRDLEYKLWPPPREIVIDKPLLTLGYFEYTTDIISYVYDDNNYRGRIKPADTIVEVKSRIFSTEASISCNEAGVQDAINVYIHYVLLKSVRDLEELLRPFLTAEFDDRWKRTVTNVDSLISQLCAVYRVNPKWSFRFFHEIAYAQFIKPSVAEAIEAFLREYKEGAFVVFAIMNASQSLRHGGGGVRRGYVNEPLHHFNAAGVPGIRGKCPYETLRVMAKIGGIFARESSKNWSSIDNSKFFNEAGSREYRRYVRTMEGSGDYCRERLRKRFKQAPVRPLRECMREAGIVFPSDPQNVISLYSQGAIQPVMELVQTHWIWFSGEGWRVKDTWKSLDNFAKEYHVGRACEIIGYGYDLANISFPPSGLVHGEEIVSIIMRLIEFIENLMEEGRQYKSKEYWQKSINEEAERTAAGIKPKLPVRLEPRVLSEKEREQVLKACVDRLNKDGMTGEGYIEVINQFAQFCALLSRPENHILVPSGQYIEKKVQTRTASDMNADMAQELTNLPKYTAYAKIHQERGGGQEVAKLRIETIYQPRLEQPKPLIQIVSYEPKLLE